MKKERMPPLLMENLLSTRERATDWTYQHHHKISPAPASPLDLDPSMNSSTSWNTTNIYSAACNHN